jgi:hypothetical protein
VAAIGHEQGALEMAVEETITEVHFCKSPSLCHRIHAIRQIFSRYRITRALTPWA